MCACVHVCMCACVHVCMCACVHMCMCACVHVALIVMHVDLRAVANARGLLTTCAHWSLPSDVPGFTSYFKAMGVECAVVCAVNIATSNLRNTVHAPRYCNAIRKSGIWQCSSCPVPLRSCDFCKAVKPWLFKAFYESRQQSEAPAGGQTPKVFTPLTLAGEQAVKP